MDAILSVKPYFADAILAGIKTVELRTVAPRKEIERAWIYSTAPVQRVVGYFKPGRIVPMGAIVKGMHWAYSPSAIMGDLNATEDDAYEFCKDRKYHAIEIHAPTTIIPSINPRQDLGLEYLWLAPQSFRYCGQKEQAALRERAP
ncbi:MAG: hypothetical protein ACYDHX_07835 [Methanothrix sp.]